MSDSVSLSKPAAATSFPPGVKYIIGNEAAERFSFYGMKAILYAHMVSLYVGFQDKEGLDKAVLAAAESKATAITHLFNAGVYAFPMIGAILADRLLGKFKVIFWISMLYCVGHGVLSIGDHTALGMYIGLTCIAVGAGGIKPCVSANVGDQFTSANANLIPKVYQMFYFSINFGSFFSTLLIPWLYKHPDLGPKYGPMVAFAVPGVLMGIATFIFWLGKNRFVKIPPKPGGRLGMLDFIGAVLFFLPFVAAVFAREFIEAGVEGSALADLLGTTRKAVWSIIGAFSVVSLGAGIMVFNHRQELEPDPGFLAVMLYSFRNQKKRQPGMGFFEVATERYGQEGAEGPPAVLRIMLVFSMVSVFWALFDQHSSTWIKQAGLMNLTIDLFGNTMALSASQIPALNPLMVMMIIPLLNFGVYRPLERFGFNFSPLRRMTAGMFLTAVAFGAATWLQAHIEAAPKGSVPVSWQMIQYWLITTAEVLVSVTGLEFAYTQAPRSMKSTIMGFWLLCVTFGNLLVVFLAPLEETLALSEFFGLFAVLMAGAATAFAGLAYMYKGKSYLQGG